VVDRIREVARLETLDLQVYKKIAYAPEPTPSGALWKDVLAWAKSSLFPSMDGPSCSGRFTSARSLEAGRAAVAHPGEPDRDRASSAAGAGGVAPGETEIISSNLDSAQTSQLLALAREAFEREVMADPSLQARARGSAERALTGLCLSLGFREVVFVDGFRPSGAG
jgi:hypothetical protein